MTDNTPLVSIIIPLFNAEKHIAETIQSAQNQSWPNKEIIIIDDGSTDNSLAIAQRYASDWVKILSQENKGSGTARNYGLREAKGYYIQFLDADDLLSANKISTQVQLLLQHPGKVAVCSTVHFNTSENPYSNSPALYEEAFLYDTDNPVDFLAKLFGGEDDQGSMIQTNAWLTPMDVIKKAGEWSEFYSPDDDGEFFCRVVLASKGIAYASNCFNYYRKFDSTGSLASIKTEKALRGKFRSLLLKKEHLLNAANNAKTKRALAHSATELAVDSYLVDKKLYNEIMAVIKELGGTSYTPTLGGPKIELIKKIFGWRGAKLLQHYLK